MELFNSAIENEIINILKEGGIRTVDLIQKIKKQRLGTSKQAVYRILRKLNRREIIILARGNVSLNSFWIKRTEEFFKDARDNYLGIKDRINTVLSLEEGDRVEYFFKNPTLTDVFWNDTVVKLLSLLKKGENIYVYNPHDWFLLARPETETQLMRLIKSKGLSWLVAVPSKCKLDALIQKFFDGKSGRYSMIPKPLFKNNHYINVVGEYIIEVFLDKGVSETIEQIYRKYDTYSDEAAEELHHVISLKGKNKLVVSHNKRKAQKLRATLKRHFVLI
ncbi:MAG TPA: hypothetical protein VEC13_00540 [Candidatus Paceibacterota bacterium]|nr:hypothetical protein [Candidatus Paceibacterota bacterium]